MVPTRPLSFYISLQMTEVRHGIKESFGFPPDNHEARSGCPRRKQVVSDKQNPLMWTPAYTHLLELLVDFLEHSMRLEALQSSTSTGVNGFNP